MIRVYKYPVGVRLNYISTHEDAKFIKIDQQQDGLHIWAIVDTNKPTAAAIINVVGTGWDIEDKNIYIDTVQTKDGYVWHAFQLTY